MLSTRLAWDLIAIMEAWLAHLQAINWTLMTKPTPSRGRTLRNLTVNVHHPITLLSTAWLTARFGWNPDVDDEAIEATLQREDDVRAYASAASVDWMAFLTQHGDHLPESGLIISSSRADVTFSELLSYLRLHSAFHYRQLVQFLATEHVVLQGALSIDTLRDLELPAAVF